ncbi:hypothetical protein [Gordonia sp. CPCC 205333]|uniref:hypothetical protein n=1 Tax=Gordonia sp. CPCC 205333 TaxID=3140790 RepID=UPI003AF35F16
MSKFMVVVLSILAAVFVGGGVLAPASASPSVPIPPKPNRDQANVDARTFQVSPGVFAFKSPSGNVACKIDTTVHGSIGCQTGVSVKPAGGPACSNKANNKYLVAFENGNVIHRCTSQGIFYASRQPVLAYGKTVMVQSTSCTSTVHGIACYQNHGFMISRDVNISIR